jgi:hypothetical protein
VACLSRFTTPRRQAPLCPGCRNLELPELIPPAGLVSDPALLTLSLRAPVVPCLQADVAYWHPCANHALSLTVGRCDAAKPLCGDGCRILSRLCCRRGVLWLPVRCNSTSDFAAPVWGCMKWGQCDSVGCVGWAGFCSGCERPVSSMQSGRDDCPAVRPAVRFACVCVFCKREVSPSIDPGGVVPVELCVVLWLACMGAVLIAVWGSACRVFFGGLTFLSLPSRHLCWHLI